MSNVSRPWSVLGFIVCLAALSAAPAQAQALPETALQKQFNRIDLAVVAIGQITGSVSGTEQRNQTPLTQKASSTAGVLATLRYTKSPLIGFEVNFHQARFTENFSNYVIGGAQTKANEYSAGYLAHLHTIAGLDPFAGAGLGTLAFHPTAGGGQGLPFQYRAVYYYNVGVDKALFSNFGVRVGLRQIFYKAPDFGQNYLTIQQHTSTLEPIVGFYLKF